MKKLMIIMLLFSSFAITPIQTYASTAVNQAVTTNLGKSTTTVSIRSAETGNILYENNGNKMMSPASNMKLLTGAAALATLGEDYRFTTELYIDGSVVGSTLNGDLYIKGSGDPTLQVTDFQQFAKVLKRQGIRTIKGAIYGDDGAFTGATITPGVEKQDESDYYAARTSALTMSPNNDYDASTLIVNVKPSKVGKAPTYTIAPNLSGMTITNQAKTVKKGQPNTLTIKRLYNSNKISISGNIPIGSSKKEWVTLHNPTMNTLHSIKLTLQAAGINFSAKSTVDVANVPKDAKLLYMKQSMTLKALYPTFMKLSNNSIADILVKAMGQHEYGVGDTKTGLRVMREYGQSIGLSMDSWIFEDGSGMSAKNKVTANELTLLLYKVKDRTFYNGLPIGGASDRLVGGTLRKRLTDSYLQNRVIAKTGYITNIYTLSGQVKAKSGRTVLFSIMVENKSSAIKGIDETVKAIYRSY